MVCLITYIDAEQAIDCGYYNHIVLVPVLKRRMKTQKDLLQWSWPRHIYTSLIMLIDIMQNIHYFLYIMIHVSGHHE
jgi:hypothetical protein